MTWVNETCQSPHFLLLPPIRAVSTHSTFPPTTMSSVTSHARSLYLLQLCQVCPSSPYFSCFSVLPTLPFQTLSSNLRILKQIPCSFSSNIYSHFSFSHAIANPIPTKDLLEFCLFSFFSSEALVTSTEKLLIV